MHYPPTPEEKQQMEAQLNKIFDPHEWDAPFDRRIVYDENDQPSIIIEVRGDKSATAAEILRAIQFLQEYWDTDESEA